ncbi:glycoside hydrolase family 2 protein [Microbacterium terrisoli]|uniref:glycoside hydrolase family 2 protein n=1 Tax=Microbacterium terrisoli TaxID=3242192 RepID=UPI002803EF68|nr:glycoside hydrolase family 2 TIM barrel-domain containing protein [Microbacterium protaetiae]
MTTIDLCDSGWRLKEYLPGDWSRPELPARARATTTGWIDAQVPGSIQHDLWAADEIADPYVGRNSLAMEWVAERTWVYVCDFSADPRWRSQRAQLRLDGVDYAARFVLNGVELGVHESMSTPALFDIGPQLRYDRLNELTVILAPAPAEQDQMGRTSLVRSRKSRMGYWWDFCPRIINLGLCGAVSIELTGPVRIDDVWPRPRLDAHRSRAEVPVTVAVDTARPCRAEFGLVVTGPDGWAVQTTTTADLDAGTQTLELSVTLEHAQLWWPNGHGEQPLYRAAVTARCAEEESHAAHADFGLRTVEVMPNKTDDPSAPPYTFVVNGRTIYLNGWNWVPLDALSGRAQDDKLDDVLELAARAHVNLLRVNGVGLIESSRFYDACDRLGIMIWQEFQVTSSEQDRKPSEDAQYLAAVTAEARRIVPLRRSHPALVIWCAGNELEGSDKLPLDDTEPLIAALRDVATELDPQRHWLPTSPVGRKPFNGLPSIRRDPDGLHDVHGPWLYEGLEAQYELYNAGTSLLHSEFGCEGLTNPETLRDLLPPGELHVERLMSSSWRHLSAWWVRPQLWTQWLGPVDDLDRLAYASQMLQAEGVRYAIESNRRRIPRNSGSLPWQFNEPYPMAAGTSAIDYHARPKALYYAVAGAYRPLALSARYDRLAWGGERRFEADVWVVSALAAAVRDAVVHARVLSVTGEVCSQTTMRCDAIGGLPVRLCTISCTLAEIGSDAFFLDLRLVDAGGATLSTWRTAFSRTADLAPLLKVAQTSLEVVAADQATRIEIANTGTHAAMHVRVSDDRPVHAQGQALFSDSHFCLLPGESAALHAQWRRVPAAQRRVRVQAANSTAYRR